MIGIGIGKGQSRQVTLGSPQAQSPTSAITSPVGGYTPGGPQLASSLLSSLFSFLKEKGLSFSTSIPIRPKGKVIKTEAEASPFVPHKEKEKKT
jgi:hypothetical protein